MNRAKPTDMRKALIIVQELKLAGILFVPIPVISDDDGKLLLAESGRRLDILAKQAESEELAMCNG